MTPRPWLNLLAAAAMAAVLVSCAATPTATRPAEQQEQTIFFPAPPSPPRIQFLTSLSSASSWSKGRQDRSSFAQWVAGDEQTTTAPDRIDTPYGVAAYKGKLYVCDVGRDVVHVIDAATGRYSLLGSPGLFKNPVNITIDRDGTKYVCDTVKGMVLVFDANDQFVHEFGDPQTLTPMDLAIAGDELYIVDSGDSEIEVWSKAGSRLRTFGRKGRGPDEFDGPSNIAIGPDDRLYVSDTMAQQVKIFDRQGRYNGSIGRPGSEIGAFARPKGIAIDAHGHVYVTDAMWRVVQIFTGNDQLLAIISGMGGKAPGIVLPAAIAIDTTSLPMFQNHLDPDFAAEYLIFLVNQYGRNKVSVYAYGRSKSLPASAYEMPQE